MLDINIAKKELLSKNKTLVAVKNEIIIYSSNKRGIGPMYELIIEREEKNMVIADRVIGKGAALLSLIGKPKIVHGEVMSKSAMEIFDRESIEYTYKEEVEFILNRDCTNICPIEKMAIESENLEDFLRKLKMFLKKE